jgi:hypothetical protein
MKTGRRNLLKMAGVGAAVAGFAVEAQSADTDADWERAVPELQAVLARRMGLANEVSAAVFRRLAAIDLRPRHVAAPDSDGIVTIHADEGFDRRWEAGSDATLSPGFLAGSVALLTEQAAYMVRGPEAVFRCDAACSFGGITLYAMRSRASGIALISSAVGAPMIKSLRFASV